jgi:hypothetical protein
MLSTPNTSVAKSTSALPPQTGSEVVPELTRTSPEVEFGRVIKLPMESEANREFGVSEEIFKVDAVVAPVSVELIIVAPVCNTTVCANGAMAGVVGRETRV